LFSWPLGGCEKGNETLTRRIYRKGVEDLNRRENRTH
jgi:hypothetical protein